MDKAASQELQALAKADQDDRKDVTDFAKLPPERFKAILARDAERRTRVLALLQAGKVMTAEDLDAAALILQHGQTPDDFLLGHELAVVQSVLEGKPAQMIALSEDRFLERIGRKQRFGSQLRAGKDGKWYSNPLDAPSETAVTEALREDYFLPTQTEVNKAGYEAAMTDCIDARIARWKRGVRQGQRAARFHGRTQALALYRADRLRAPADFRRAAEALMASGRGPDFLLAHELAVVAAVRGDKLARRTLAQAWDRFLVGAGLPQRYGTIAGAPVAKTASRSVREILGV